MTDLAKIPAILLVENPKKVLADASRVAKAIDEVIRQQKDKRQLVVRIRDHDYLRVEAWQMFGAPFGITASVVSCDPITVGTEHGPVTVGFKAHAEAVRNGAMISEGWGFSMMTEKGREDQPQCAGMAQTRAVSRALRNALSWVVVLAGYQPTPAEEMDRIREGEEHDGQRTEEGS